MWFKENWIDWVVLSIFILCIIVAIVEHIRGNKRSAIAPMRFVGFAWVTISWGAYAGATTMVLYTGFFYLMQRELSFLNVRQEKPLMESARYVLLALIPIGAWFTWWATMGQLDGLSHRSWKLIPNRGVHRRSNLSKQYVGWIYGWRSDDFDDHTLVPNVQGN